MQGAHGLTPVTVISIEGAMAKLHKLWSRVCKCMLATYTVCMFRTKLLTGFVFGTSVTPLGAPGCMSEALSELQGSIG
jgi:hypothetical protein